MVSIEFPWAAPTPDEPSHVPCRTPSHGPATSYSTSSDTTGANVYLQVHCWEPLNTTSLPVPAPFLHERLLQRHQMEIAPYFSPSMPPCRRLSHPNPHFCSVPGEMRAPTLQQGRLQRASTTSQHQICGVNRSLSTDFNSRWLHSPVPLGLSIPSWAAFLFGSP